MYLRRLQAEVAEGSDERSLKLLARARDLLADVDLGTDMGDGLVICPRLRFGSEVVSTTTMVARFAATREVTLDELRVELIFPATRRRAPSLNARRRLTLGSIEAR